MDLIDSTLSTVYAMSQALAARYVTNKRINNIVRFPQ
jgi:hypothetical protein